MSVEVANPALSAPGDWDRYFRVNVDLSPLRGTPGLFVTDPGDTVDTPSGQLIQAARHGMFLRAPGPLSVDPAEISSSLAGIHPSSHVPINGTRRSALRRSATGIHSQFEQLIRGAPVVGSEIRVHHDVRGVFAVTGRPLADIEARDPGPAPKPDDAEALAACSESFGLGGPPTAVRVQQVVFPEDESATWAYEISFVVLEHAADVRTYLRCDTLEVLLSYNVSAAASARIYPVNPLQSPDLLEVAIDGLEVPGTMLRGGSLDVGPASGGRVERDDGDFRLDPADPTFDEPSAYHHLWHGIAYFREMLRDGLMDKRPFAPLTAVVNDPRYVNNAYYFPSTGQLHFGVFDGDRPSSRSAAVMIHELTHAVTDTISKLSRAYVETDPARGLSEGYSDYFAASMLDDPRFGDYVTGKPDGQRNCAWDGLRFPDQFSGPPHETGTVWASVLWAIRASIGQAAADHLAIESVNYVDHNSTFENARTALHTADDQLSQGAHAAHIDAAFDPRLPA
jgi:hypothetical protein